MRKRSGLKIGMVCAVALSGVAVMPAPSWATTTLSTRVASTSSTGPNSANTEVTSVANCSSKLVSAGGARVDVTSGTMPNGLKLDGSVPSTNGQRAVCQRRHQFHPLARRRRCRRSRSQQRRDVGLRHVYLIRSFRDAGRGAKRVGAE